MGLTLPKAKDLSHLVDSRIGIPDADVNTEIVVNGGFDSVDGWTEGIDCNISNGKLNCVAKPSNGSCAYQMYDFTPGKTYKISFDLEAIASTQVKVYLSGTSYLQIFFHTTSGHKEYLMTADTDPSPTLYVYGSGTWSMDNLSIKEWDGEELVPDPDVGFVANQVSSWTVYGTNTIEQDGDAVRITHVDNSNGALVFLDSTTKGTTFDADLITGQKYRLTLRAKVSTGSAGIQVNDDSGLRDDSTVVTNTSYQIFNIDWTVGDIDTYIRCNNLSTGEILWIEMLSVKKVTGLVAAYNMIPSPEGVLVDISGNGNNLTISKGWSISDEGIYCNGDKAGGLIAGDTRIISGDFSISFRIKIFETPGTPWFLIASRGITDYIGIADEDYMRCYTGAGGAFNIDFPYTMSQNKWHTVTLTRTSDIYQVYLDGILGETISGESDADFNVGDIGATGYLINCELGHYINHNYPLSAEEAQQYHNSFQKLTKRGNFSDHAVGSTI
jgi:hypothetical protein